MTAPENKGENKNEEFRILVLMPTGRDSELVSQTLENAGLRAKVSRDLQDLEADLDAKAGAILLAEEALTEVTFQRLVEIVQQQPVWSDIPVVLLAGDQQNSEKLLDTVGTQINITILERPLPKAILISAMRGALRARKKQYETRNLLTELKEADEQKDLFLATLSHELRTPLNSMLGWIELLKNNDRNFDRNHALDVIERNAKAQTQIISDILLLSRVVTGKFEIENKLIKIDAVVQVAVDIIEPLVKDKKISLNVAYNDAGCRIRGDFWNILSNAAKFTPFSGNINIETFCHQSEVSIKISDDGQGIKEDFLPFVFERFRQADSSYTRNVGGLGLGLAIVRNIVEQHGGKISVESEGEGKGAAFIVTLPIASSIEAVSESETMKDNLPSDSIIEGLRILIAEDDDDSREMLSVLLSQSEMQIEAVATATEALNAVTQNPPDLLISDVGMPDMDGYRLIEKIRALPSKQGGKIPAIALTGYASSQDRARSLEAGYQAHLTKPIDFDELFQAIRSVLSEHGEKQT
jgi:signal transduction histidine kinase/ActR/RegA family two-component response regulator